MRAVRVHEEYETWMPEPVRPRWQSALRFAATLVFFPLLCAVWPAVAAVLFVVGLFTDLITAVGEGFGDGCMRFVDDTLGAIARLGSWCVTWPEPRHEGDTEYYRARVGRKVAHWTTRATDPEGGTSPVECGIPRRDHRGVGGRYVAEAALAQGWELRPTDVRRKVRLAWPAAPGAAGADPAQYLP
ncbi:hypothetical protein [Streptomyces sp. WG7]|uniref:hypothetical protein n=1 Tax=Streptomyces sp. WG7 TaxID=3417650 RepID=UPI003CE7F122